MNNTVSLSNKNYDAYFIENKTGENFNLPNGCYGAIGITLDDLLKGYKHVALQAFNTISTSLQGYKKNDSFNAIDLTNIMHGFVVTSQIDKTTLNVCEAIGKGFVSAEIKIGDWDWTSMVLFVPKDKKVADMIIQNSMQELKSDKMNEVAEYGYLNGIISVLTRKNSSSFNKQVIAAEMADLITSRSIRDRDQSPKACICSQLALRILRNSILMSAIPQNEMKKYQLMNRNEIENKILQDLASPESPLSKAYSSSKLFEVEADVDMLPYELYLALKKSQCYTTVLSENH